jgi:hypothetical protein
VSGHYGADGNWVSHRRRFFDLTTDELRACVADYSRPDVADLGLGDVIAELEAEIDYRTSVQPETAGRA